MRETDEDSFSATVMFDNFYSPHNGGITKTKTVRKTNKP